MGKGGELRDGYLILWDYDAATRRMWDLGLDRTMKVGSLSMGENESCVVCFETSTEGAKCWLIT